MKDELPLCWWLSNVFALWTNIEPDIAGRIAAWTRAGGAVLADVHAGRIASTCRFTRQHL